MPGERREYRWRINGDAQKSEFDVNRAVEAHSDNRETVRMINPMRNLESSARPALTDALSETEMFGAVRRRDASYVGLFWVGVRTTGVFCRPGCPSRSPARRNCVFFRSTRDALARGFRPCKRCKPMDSPTAGPAWAEKLMHRYSSIGAGPLSTTEVRSMGIHPSTASRFLKRRLGVTLAGISRTQRAHRALLALRSGEKLSDAVSQGDFGSESGLRKAVEALFGSTPAVATGQSATPLIARWISSPLGPLLAVASDAGLCILEFLDRRILATKLQAVRSRMRLPIIAGDHELLRGIQRELTAYFDGDRSGFRTPLDPQGTPFQRRVWNELLRIPRGQTRSYADVAAAVGNPRAVRAVARANGENRLAIVIPCHRVIGADGRLVGYGGGLWRKRRLLEIEGALLPLA